ncbi:MAG TPA: hypothetical protein PLB18_09070 [Acidobacteriota bacterium]|nr:hypothetical protein [Acidobacteriota bacterium]HNJ39589.1 hypothetical protein [Acidobacteriota bacterium]
MKSQTKKTPRRFHPSNTNRPKTKPNRPFSNEGPSMSSGMESPAPTSVSFVDNLEGYLADQMRELIRARQEQEQALRDIRSLGEQLALGQEAPRLREQYEQAVSSWQTSRRNGVNARQRLLVAMTERAVPDRK